MRCMVMKIRDGLDLGNYMICHSPNNQYVFTVSSRPVEKMGESHQRSELTQIWSGFAIRKVDELLSIGEY